jgi:hypothetical protein
MPKKKWTTPAIETIKFEETKSGAGSMTENSAPFGNAMKFNDAGTSP